MPEHTLDEALRSSPGGRGLFSTSPSGVTTEQVGPPEPPVVGPVPIFQQIRSAFDLLDQREKAARDSGDDELAGQYRIRRQEFSDALNVNERKENARRGAQRRGEAIDLRLDSARQEAATRKRFLGDPANSKLIQSVRRAALLSQLMKGVPGAIQRNIISPRPQATGPSIQQQRLDLARRSEQRQIAAGQDRTSRQEETAEARTPEARFDTQVSLIERELGKKLTRAQRLRLLKNPDIIEEFAAEVEKNEAPFTQSPGDEGGELEVATREQIRAAAERIGATDVESIEAELEKEGLRVQ